MNNEYLPFRSEILEVIKHADVEYTFRMSYDRGKNIRSNRASSLKSLSRNTVKRPFPSAALPTIPWISPSVKSAA